MITDKMTTEELKTEILKLQFDSMCNGYDLCLQTLKLYVDKFDNSIELKAVYDILNENKFEILPNIKTNK